MSVNSKPHISEPVWIEEQGVPKFTDAWYNYFENVDTTVNVTITSNINNTSIANSYSATTVVGDDVFTLRQELEELRSMVAALAGRESGSTLIEHNVTHQDSYDYSQSVVMRFDGDVDLSQVYEHVDTKADRGHDHAGMYATSTQGELAETSLQPGDNVSELTNDAGYISSVAWGDISGTLADQTDLQAELDGKATSAQGALADSAVQPGDNVSLLTNDAGYITSASVITDHGALSGLGDDDHPQYYNETRGDARYVQNAALGAASGVATLDASGKLLTGQLPALAITDTFVVASQVAMLALSAAEQGDVAVRTDENKSYILAGTDPATLGDWQELLSPTSAVTSVNSQTGSVVLNADDIDDTSTSHKFTSSAEISKLAGIEAGAEVNTVDSVNSQTGAVVIDADDIDDTSTTHKFASAAELSKLSGIETGAQVNTVTSVAGKTGAVTLVKADITDFNEADYATGAEGDLATTALQPGDNISELVNDAGYVTSAGVTDHGALTGLGDDDHTQYHTDARGDARYAQRSNNLSDLASASTARTNLGLGTAATANVTTSATDTTSGRVLKVGDGGLLSLTGVTISGSEDLDDYWYGGGKPQGLYRWTAPEPTNAPAGYCSMLLTSWGDGGQQTVFRANGIIYYRNKTNSSSGWSAWVEIYHSGNLTGAVSTIATSNLTANRAMISNGSGKAAVSAVTATELGYSSGVTSAIQTQLNSKQATITGAASTVVTSNLTASRATVSDGSGKLAASSVTATELGYLSGVTSNIQTQINGISTSLAWGSITGTLSDQADLQSALNNKADVGTKLSTDWNAITETGMYTNGTNNTAPGLPTNLAHLTLVHVQGSITDQASQFSVRTGTGESWTRVKNGGTWQAWLKYATSSDLNGKLNTTGGTMTGTLLMNNARIELTSQQPIRWYSSGGFQSMDGRLNGTNVDLHCYGSSTASANTAFRWQLFDGSAYRLLTTSGNTLSYGGNDLVHRGMPHYNGSGGTAGASFTLAIGGAGTIVGLTGIGSPQTVTIPTNASVPFPVGTVIVVFLNSGTGASWTLAGASGVNLRMGVNPVTTTASIGAYAYGRLVKFGTNGWLWIPGIM